MLTCEYCFSPYVAAETLLITPFKLLFPDWRGYVLVFFALAWIANQYMRIYNRLRLDIKHEQMEIRADEQTIEKQKAA